MFVPSLFILTVILYISKQIPRTLPPAHRAYGPEGILDPLYYLTTAPSLADETVRAYLAI
jgi:hypothetical protein